MAVCRAALARDVVVSGVSRWCPHPWLRSGWAAGLIGDLQVADPGRWGTLGVDLLVATRERLADRVVMQIVVVCREHDQRRRDALTRAGLSLASEW